MRRYSLAVIPFVVACVLPSTMSATATDEADVDYLQELAQLDVATLSDELIQSVQATLDALDPVIAEHQDVYGLHRVDWDSKSIIVYLTDEQKTPDVRAIIESVAERVDGGAAIRFQTAAVTMDELDQASQKLFASRAEWAQDPSAVYYTYPDVPNATIHVGMGAILARGDLPVQGATSSGDPYKIEYSYESGEPTLLSGSRLSDQGGWTGGNWLGTDASTVPTTTNSHCGLGFTWRRWSDGRLLGGTGEHCINLRHTGLNCGYLGVSFPMQFHDGRHLGTAIATDPGSDSAFLAPAAGTSFNATVWVGGPGTTVERAVTGSREYDAQGDVVVLSGPRTGGSATETVVAALRFTTCLGPKTVLQDAFGDYGDSGSPWLTTYGDGTVRAHGTFVGFWPWNGRQRSLYTPVSVTSSRLEASIAVAP